jgi:hypothetical protein
MAINTAVLNVSCMSRVERVPNNVQIWDEVS